MVLTEKWRLLQHQPVLLNKITNFFCPPPQLNQQFALVNCPPSSFERPLGCIIYVVLSSVEVKEEKLTCFAG